MLTRAGNPNIPDPRVARGGLLRSPAASSPGAVVIADVDGDGKIDLMVGDSVSAL